MFRILLVCLTLMTATAHAIQVFPACPATSGPLTLNVSSPRTTGISPLLVFFDATATTDTALTGNTTPFQDVAFSWKFGDVNPSGTSNWLYGSHPATSSRNVATGGVAAHLYVAARDSRFTIIVTATDGTNTVSCGLGTTVYNPSGTNGFPTTSTTCVAAASTPIAGAGGCPAGATVLNTSSFATALGATYFGSGKRVLFKCGDTFTGDAVTLTGTKWSVGAYGGCEGTQTSRPIFSDTGINDELIVALASGDGRIADIDFEGTGTAASAVNTPQSLTRIPYQITLSNLVSNGNNASYAWSQGAQWGSIGNVMNSMRTNIGMFVNYNENNPGTWSGNVFNNLDYQALLGNLFNGAGGTNGQGQETVRVSACRMCAIENNTMENANNVGAVFKLHNGNTNNSCAGNANGGCWPCTVGALFATTTCWTGVYTELSEISDNLFTGTSGANLVELAPQNNNDDERLRNIVFERNLVSSSTGAQGGRLLMVSAVDTSVRDNVFYMPGTTLIYPVYGAQSASRGLEPVPFGVEIYNNTCYAPNAISSQLCAGFDALAGMTTASTNSYAKNNLFYIAAAGHATFTDNGTGNTVGSNTATSTNNPGFTNGSGSFSLISDFKPTANYSGGATVPVFSDALGIAWSPWDLGAVHH